MTNLELEKTANEIRKSIVTAVHSAKSGHPGGSLSSADIFTYLYFEEMNIDPKNPKMEDRDRFVLSKGHVAPGLYSTLAERGYFPKEDLVTLRHTGSYLQGHPDMKHIPGVDMSSGSLGQGLSVAVGMAAVGKYDKKDYRVYTLCGDGEIQEGQIWEAAMWAGFKKPSRKRFNFKYTLEETEYRTHKRNEGFLARKIKSFKTYEKNRCNRSKTSGDAAGFMDFSKSKQLLCM
jgi:transketolase